MRLELPADRATLVLRPAELPEPHPVAQLVEQALATPIGAVRLAAAPGARVTLIVSDATRDEPRGAFIEAVLARLPSDIRLTIAIATGTHGPTPSIEALGIPADALTRATIINHDGHRAADLIELGTTTRGTPVRVHRCVVDTDLVIATGCIRPHYFAGFGAGSKAIFPGLGEATAVRINHELKTHPTARAGIVDGNHCREDLEEALRFMRAPVFLLNGVVGPDARVHAVFAGDPLAAFRAGTTLATPWYRVRATPAPLVVASDSPPVTTSLYQAAKIAAGVAPLVAPGGTLAIVADCTAGLGGPLDTVNEKIFRIGVLPRLAPNVRLVLVRPTPIPGALVEHATNLAAVAASAPAGHALVVPHATRIVAEALPS